MSAVKNMFKTRIEDMEKIAIAMNVVPLEYFSVLTAEQLQLGKKITPLTSKCQCKITGMQFMG